LVWVTAKAFSFNVAIAVFETRAVDKAVSRHDFVQHAGTRAVAYLVGAFQFIRFTGGVGCCVGVCVVIRAWNTHLAWIVRVSGSF
jgi:hypothetical protein